MPVIIYIFLFYKLFSLCFMFDDNTEIKLKRNHCLEFKQVIIFDLKAALEKKIMSELSFNEILRETK